MLYIDTKFANLLSPQLELFKIKQQNPYLANFRCPLCGDSKKNKRKTRGYLYTKKGSLFYKCHNCGVGTNFGNLLKTVNVSLFDQYRMERYKEGLDMGNAARPNSKVEFKFEAPVFEEKNLLDRLLPNLKSLPDHNPAVEFARRRKIPESRFKDLYYIDDVSKIEQLSPKYKEKIKDIEPKLLIPFYGIDGTLVGVSCRDLGDNNLRYLTIHIDKDSDMIYNLDRIDRNKTIYVTEGPFDSMFLDNACSVGNTSLTSVEKYLPKEKCVLVFDNQPRNREVVKIIRRAVESGWQMVIWPNNIEEKDINDMVMAGIDVQEMINKSTWSGLRLILKFNEWSKV